MGVFCKVSRPGCQMLFALKMRDWVIDKRSGRQEEYLCAYFLLQFRRLNFHVIARLRI